MARRSQRRPRRERLHPGRRALATRDGRGVSVAGLVLVRQRPGSANRVLFITIEDETEIANLIIWPSLFERQRRLILSASMIGCRGKVQREGEVIHVIAEHLTDLSGLLDHERLSAGLRGAHLQATRGLRLLWLPREPCRVLRAHRLRLIVDEVSPSRRVPRGDLERSADGVLCARPISARC
jgi:DNA polymerase III alpha subunit